MSITEAISQANKILPGEAATDETKIDPRWQAIIEVGKYAESEPVAVWEFAESWGQSQDADLRSAIATCLVEELLALHFDLLFQRVADLALRSETFADTFARCWKLGQSARQSNAKQFDAVKSKCKLLRSPN